MLHFSIMLLLLSAKIISFSPLREATKIKNSVIFLMVVTLRRGGGKGLAIKKKKNLRNFFIKINFRLPLRSRGVRH